MTDRITAKQAQVWISDNRNHGVHINSGALNDICATVIALHAELARVTAEREAADHRAGAAEAKVAEIAAANASFKHALKSHGIDGSKGSKQ